MSAVSISSLKSGVEEIPFPHIVLDDWLQPELVRAARIAFPDETWQHWHVYSDHHSQKLASKDALRLPEACRLLINEMARMPIGDMFEARNTFPDMELHAAGMHMIPVGGRLARHVDAERHPIKGWGRTHSAVLMLNDGNGGSLVLGDRSVGWRSGRLVVFECGPNSWHEVTTVDGPNNRLTLSLFWWQQLPPDNRCGNCRSVFAAD